MTVIFAIILFQLSEIYRQTMSVDNPFSNNLKIYIFKKNIKKNRKKLN
jgi:hypothetical protein